MPGIPTSTCRTTWSRTTGDRYNSFPSPRTTNTTAPTGFVVGGNLSIEDDPAAVLAQLLATTWERVLSPDQHVVDRLRAVEEHYGVLVLPEGFAVGGPVDAGAVLLAVLPLTVGVAVAERASVDRRGVALRYMIEARPSRCREAAVSWSCRTWFGGS